MESTNYLKVIAVFFFVNLYTVNLKINYLTRNLII
jgi:hypothetical protein